jgi:rare lipoprotein A (peptidoglycan hydrolase)
MSEGDSRRTAAARHTSDRHARGRRARASGRPDRIALWAVVLAIFSTVVAAGSAQAGTGGVAIPSPDRVANPSAEAFVAANATWYGPGFYGNRTACGKVLRRGTIGVAHRKLPCGTKVTFSYKGRTAVAPVIDRGPYRRGYMWDLTAATADRLGFAGSGRVLYAISSYR